MLAEIANAFIGIGFFLLKAAIPNMMRFINNHKVKMRSGIEIEKAVLLTATVLLALIDSAVQNRIRNNCLVIAYRPFFVPMRVRNRLSQGAAVQRNKVLIKAPHFQLPLAFCHKWFWADDQDIIQLVASFQFLNDETCFDGFTNTDAVRNQNLGLI